MPPKVYEVRHDITCEHCGADLRQANSIEIHFASNGGHQWDRTGEVDKDGLLIDIDGDILDGKHAGSFCAICNECLEETGDT